MIEEDEYFESTGLETDNISNMAHIVGGIVGAVLGYNLNKKSKYGF